MLVATARSMASPRGPGGSHNRTVIRLSFYSYATQAARDGHHPTQIAATTRHQDQRVRAGYIRAGRGKDDIAHVL
jgi:hypothetical protein